MSLNLALINEEGCLIDEVEDASDRLRGLIPPGQDRAFPFLRRIFEGDVSLICGDEVDYLIQEIQRLIPRAERAEESELLAKISRMADLCEAKADLSLEFTVFNSRELL